ncbi:hypothetical protein PSPO01_07281, partial [Paraphaeosphaeria sporulosa]
NSTFVARCAGKPLPQAGHGLGADTTSVAIESFQRKGKTVHLIDTPSFDDNHKDDVTVIQELAFWLLQAYNNGLRPNRLVFMRRTTDNHVQGSTLRALEVFKAMSGAHCYPPLSCLPQGGTRSTIPLAATEKPNWWATGNSGAT